MVHQLVQGLPARFNRFQAQRLLNKRGLNVSLELITEDGLSHYAIEVLSNQCFVYPIKAEGADVHLVAKASDFEAWQKGELDLDKAFELGYFQAVPEDSKHLLKKFNRCFRPWLKNPPSAS
jgi:hypothetical protein